MKEAFNGSALCTMTRKAIPGLFCFCDWWTDELGVFLAGTLGVL